MKDKFLRQKPVELERLIDIAKVQSTEASNRIESIITSQSRLEQISFAYSGRFSLVLIRNSSEKNYI